MEAFPIKNCTPQTNKQKINPLPPPSSNVLCDILKSWSAENDNKGMVNICSIVKGEYTERGCLFFECLDGGEGATDA